MWYASQIISRRHTDCGYLSHTSGISISSLLRRLTVVANWVCGVLVLNGPNNVPSLLHWHLLVVVMSSRYSNKLHTYEYINLMVNVSQLYNIWEWETIISCIDFIEMVTFRTLSSRSATHVRESEVNSFVKKSATHTHVAICLLQNNKRSLKDNLCPIPSFCLCWRKKNHQF